MMAPMIFSQVQGPDFSLQAFRGQKSDIVSLLSIDTTSSIRRCKLYSWRSASEQRAMILFEPTEAQGQRGQHKEVKRRRREQSTEDDKGHRTFDLAACGSASEGQRKKAQSGHERSEERRVGKECRSRRGREHEKKKEEVI